MLRSILYDDSDTETRVWLISANKTEQDILCRSELDSLFAKYGPDRFKLHYILSKASEAWTSSVGRVDEKLISEYMPRPSEDGLILTCGPDVMIAQAVKPGLQSVGWDIEKQLVVF